MSDGRLECPRKGGTGDHQLDEEASGPATEAPDNRSVEAGSPPAWPTRAGAAGGQSHDCLTAWQSPKPPLFPLTQTLPNPAHPSTAWRCPLNRRPAAAECENRVKFDRRLIRVTVPSSCLAGAMKCTGEYRRHDGRKLTKLCAALPGKLLLQQQTRRKL